MQLHFVEENLAWSRMLSLQSISTIKSAIQTCLVPELKREVLCAPGSEYDINKVCNQYERKRQWNEIVERKARELLTNQGLPVNLQDNLMAIVPAIGLRMLIWAEYHEGTLELTREYSIGFLKYSHFTLQGIIDNITAARELVEDDQLSIKQKYILACIYCFVDKIKYLYRQMVAKGIQPISLVHEPKHIHTPEIVKFWTYQQIGVIDAHDRHRSQNESRIQKAIKSGSKAAVEYFWEITNLRSRRWIENFVGFQALRCKESMQDDWIVFRDRRFSGSEETWVPNDYYVDILCFLLSNMIPNDQKIFLRRDIEFYGFSPDSVLTGSRILEYFLHFPYQDHFMRTASMMLDILPRKTYSVLLLKICDKIEPQIEKNLYYGEEKSYHYKSLLKEFWSESPDRYKRYVFENHTVTYVTNVTVETKTGVGLLVKLLSLKKFTVEDEEIVRLIITSASDEERKTIFSSEEWRKECIKLMKENKWEILHRFVLTCFSSKGEADMFKMELSFSEEAKLICIDFFTYNRLHGAESFIEWNSLPEIIMNDLKREIIYSKKGKDECLKLLRNNRITIANKFITWCLPSNREATAFKAKLVSELNMKCHRVHVIEHAVELVNHFSRSHRSARKQVSQLKKSIAYSLGCEICEELISDYSRDFTFNEKSSEIQTGIEFRGGKWEEVDKFLTWCFSTKEEIDDFKKYKLLENSGVKILFNLIKSKQLAEAQKFLDWLGLSVEEQTKLKKEALFHDKEAWLIFSDLVFSEERDELCSYFHNQDEREDILCWLLSNKETVLEFRDVFMNEYGSFNEINLKHFNERIERYLTKLNYERYELRRVRVVLERILDFPHQNRRGTKRKAGTFPKNKKRCSLKPKKKLYKHCIDYVGNTLEKKVELSLQANNFRSSKFL